MATFNTGFLYTLDQNGNSTNGKIVSLIPNSAASDVPAVNSNTITVDETFTVTFSDPTTGATFDGTYTYVGHETASEGVIGRDSTGAFFLFSNDPSIPIGSNLNSFVAEDFTVCFVLGTMIACPDGEHAVETISAGDIVLTESNGPRAVRWVGTRHLAIASHRRPETVAPILIERSAIANSVPHRDLLISPDHAIFVDDLLISARQLVNGTTIRQETQLASVKYFHIELDEHEILFAEGMPAESYLDTGNRGFFGNSGQPTTLRPDLTAETDHPSRQSASCRRFAWDEASVRPVWQRLANRALMLGQSVGIRSTTTDPGLGIRVNGQFLQPVRNQIGRSVFVLPPGATDVTIVSRAGLPTDSRPWLEDRRKLGVYVERVILRDGSEITEVPLDHPALSKGWWSVERNGAALKRWTDGEAFLPLQGSDGPILLEIHATSDAMEYVIDGGEERAA